MGIERVAEFGNHIGKALMLKKKTIIKICCGIVVLILISFFADYFVFGYKLNVIEKNQKGLFTLGDIKSQQFSSNENGDFISLHENASLLVSTGGKYINNIELDNSNNTGNSIFVKYFDIESGKEVVLENSLQKNILKNKLDFMKSLVFHVNDSPEYISIVVQKPHTIISAIKIDNNYYFNQYRFLFTFAVGSLVWIFYLLRRRIGEKPEYGFLVVALICGTLLVFSETKSFISWDDHIHYKNADSLTLKGIISKKTEDIYSKTNSVPHSYSIHEQKVIDEFFNNRVKKNISKNKKSEFSFSVKEFYNKIGYLPAASALMMGRILHLPYDLIFVLGRFSNLLVYSLVVFFAIRKLNSGKMLLAAIALLPTSIFLASNYSYDFWVTSFTMLGLAYLFSELQQPEKKLSKKNALIMLGSFVAGLGPKAIYFPLMLLLFLLKPSKFKSSHDYKKFIWASVISVVIVLGSFVLPFFISGDGGGDMRGGVAVNSAEQVKFILTQPIEYAKILFNFMVNYINPINAGGFMTSFAYLGSVNGFFLLLTLLIFVAITDKNNFDKESSSFKIKSLMGMTYIFTVSLICTALYVAFTAVGSETIAGVQPRYLTPLILPLLYVFGHSYANPINKNIYNTVIFAVLAAATLAGTWDLIIRYYY